MREGGLDGLLFLLQTFPPEAATCNTPMEPEG